MIISIMLVTIKNESVFATEEIYSTLFIFGVPPPVLSGQRRGEKVALYLLHALARKSLLNLL